MDERAKPDFVHLHLHTEYSLLDGACRIKRLMKRVKELGQRAVAITDHGVLYGVIDFYKAAKEAGVKPVIGCEVYVASRSRFDRTFERDNETAHLVLLCKNNEGYQNLMKLVSRGFTEGFYNRPRVDLELLREYSGGLIALSACIAGQIPRRLLADDYEGALALALEYRSVFGADGFYLEMQDHGIPAQRQVNAGILRISEETGIPLVVTNDAHYLTKEDAFAQDVLMCIQTNKTVEDPDRMRLEPDEFYVKSTEEMAVLFPNRPEALENTQKIADACEVTFEFGSYHLPRFSLPEGETDSGAYLEKLCDEGFARRYPDAPGEHRERLSYELGVIKSMGFSDYFLIVADFIAFAKGRGIPVGPGRGSGAGSIAAYCLGITDIDPIKYSLFFERFLNPERISMPDFDIDFCPNRRQEVIDYVTEKYGADHVAQIVTFGTMAARGAIRDVGRALAVPYAEVDTVAKLVPFELHMTIERALEISPRLEAVYAGDERMKRMIDTAMLLEGMPRHSSTHAAGVVITRDPVWDHLPLARNDETIVTQFPMTTVEELGLLKMDFLGLRNLTIIADAEREVRKRIPDFRVEDIPDDDEPTFRMLAEGKTVGVFQLESTGMTNVCVGLKAQSIEEITALIALYRPGPMDSIPKYIAGKHRPESVRFSHPLLEPILNVTYGCIVYQEQVMEIFRRLGGYSLGRADLVRRAMSKKKMDVLVKERENFVHGNPAEGIDGCVARGVDEKTADRLFDEIREFANYAFNKAHAACYAVVAYRTAYLKCNHPREYMAALLTSVLGDTGKVAEYSAACREMGINVLPPDVNASYSDFAVKGNDIAFGLVAVKNVGAGFISALVAEREAKGPFKSLQDFCERMYSKDLNRRAVEALIKCGAMDGFGLYRSQLLTMLERVIEAVSTLHKSVSEDQIGFFTDGADDGIGGIEAPEMEEYPLRERLAMEKETTGLYLSGHPMDEYAEAVKKAGAVPIRSILAAFEHTDGPSADGLSLDEPAAGEESYADGQILLVAGIVMYTKLKTTKNNSQMAYITIEDMAGSMEILCFSRTLAESGPYIREGSAIAVRGRLSVREDEEPKLIADVISPAGNILPAAGTRLRGNAPSEAARPAGRDMPNARGAAAKPAKVFLRFNPENRRNVDRVGSLLRFMQGDVPVVFYDSQSASYSEAPRELWLDPDARCLDLLRTLLGSENVALK